VVATSEDANVSVAARRDALGEQVFQAALGALDIYTVYLGDRLGLYSALADHGPATSTELAAATGLVERYVREWLEQQAVSGIITVENPGDGSAERRFSMPAGHAEVLVDRDSPWFLAPLAQLFVGVAAPVGQVAAAFRSGGGVPYEAYGTDMREGQAAMNRNLFLQQLGSEYLPAIADLDERLWADPPARVADIGCGVGWSCVGIANSYPKVLVDGFDLDEASVADAQTVIQAAGVNDRVDIRLRDARDLELAGRYDLVTAFECVHDMSDPVGALRTMRRLAGDTGTVLIMDERAAETFSPDAGDIERLLYGFSLLHCLPVGMADQPSAATGTVMRPATLRRYALEAGFQSVETLPLDNLFFRFYRLRG